MTGLTKTEFVNRVLIALEADNELSNGERLLIIVIAWRGNANGELWDYQGRPISLSTCAKKAKVRNLHRALKGLIKKGWLIKHQRIGGHLNLEKVEACYQQAMQATHEGIQNVHTDVYKMYTQEYTKCTPLYCHTKKYKSATRNFSSWTDRDERVIYRPTMNCSTEII